MDNTEDNEWDFIYWRIVKVRKIKRYEEPDLESYCKFR